MGETYERGRPIVVKECPVCGKRFVPTHYWAYKKGCVYYCRYNCYRQAGGDRHEKYRANAKGWV